ncbi:hemolysin III family protein [Malonomonas rubra]|uniref:PAQR family membrane homeostasis protein TrhA n=1 Tax=Malonomonas rubra TaxID=57040 RepID=UPI0026EE421A|nr:hemolysin III family protein [Malonomonas rubra]
MNGQTATEERFNSLTHLLGTIAALIGLILLIRQQTDPWKLISFSIFGSTMVLLYSISTLYHAMSGQNKRILRKLDHLAIYILIAGTYAPFTLVTLRNNWGWPVFGLVWGLAIIGIIIDLLPNKKGQRTIPIIIYLLMGWMALILAKPLLDNLPLNGFIWLLCGGLFYTFGLIFYGFDARVPFFHTIWHLFVLAGSFFHYLAVYRFIA